MSTKKLLNLRKLYVTELNLCSDATAEQRTRRRLLNELVAVIDAIVEDD